MYKTLLFFYGCCVAFTTTAQNLLLNGDFEEYWECPSNIEYIEKCKNIFNPIVKNISTSDYFNKCALPNTSTYKGNGCVGIILAIYPWMNYEPNGYAEYVQMKISKILITGERYYFSFYVKASNFSTSLTHTTDCINVKFVNDSIVYEKYLWQIMKPDWKNPQGNYFSDEWKEFKGDYIAKGGEEWVIIGFIDDSSNYKLHTLDSNSSFINFGYIYIDSFNIEPFISLPNVFTPNNDGINDLWQPIRIIEGNQEVLEIKVYNRWGKIVLEAGNEFKGWDGNCDGVPCSEGVYFATVIIENKNNNSVKKLSGNITLLR
ncbi:MAG: T9SS type B sorting domain-containing protein [Bacteroidetes bacterium]|nr:hypothetical protein [Flavobacteriales bacterium]NOG96031.1 T9SS type B sorting domain-containing protein [Bacteroidota bacterium]CAG0954739.1 hypothetical protein FLAV_00377 [Flavobacteriales bacterium]